MLIVYQLAQWHQPDLDDPPAYTYCSGTFSNLVLHTGAQK